MNAYAAINTSNKNASSTEKHGEKRGQYGELHRIGDKYAGPITDSFDDCLPDTFSNFDWKGRGGSINTDLYGFCPAEQVAVVQVRYVERLYKNGFANVHKNYFLVGRGEITGAPFSHCVSAQAVRSAVRRGADAAGVVRAVQRWMFQLSEKQLSRAVRQGDVVMTPCRAPAGLPGKQKKVLIGGSHELRAAEIVEVDQGFEYLARDPSLHHLKRQHDPLYAPADGWYLVRQARSERPFEPGHAFGD